MRLQQASRGRSPDLVNPRLFTDKLRWRMLYDRRPLLRVCSDRLAARDYVSARAGDECLVPLLGVYDRPEEIPWSSLSPPYVVKPTHGCGWNIIVRESSDVDPERFRNQLNTWLDTNYYDYWWEWSYKSVPRRLVVERFIGRDGEIPADFKIHCFHGEPQVISVYKGRFSSEAGWNRWDVAWNPLAFLSSDIHPGPLDPPPENLAALVDLARVLSSDFDYIRVDLYCVQDEVYFGELTPYPAAGTCVFSEEGETWMGALWHLPSRSAVRRWSRSSGTSG